MDTIQARIPSLIIDDERCETILKEHVNLSQEQWAVHNNSDLWLTAREAVETVLATHIADFAPPIGSVVYNVLG